MFTLMPHRSGFIHAYAAGAILLSSCQSFRHTDNPAGSNPPAAENARSSDSFLENCRSLKQSDGFRQNIWLCAKQQAWAAISMDLNRRLYLVVPTRSGARAANLADEKYRKLRIQPEQLRGRMHPDAFILGNSGDGRKPVIIHQIPDDAGESFGIDLLNALFQLDLEPEDQRFQWD